MIYGKSLPQGLPQNGHGLNVSGGSLIFWPLLSETEYKYD